MLKIGPSRFPSFSLFLFVFLGMLRNTNSAKWCQNSVLAKLSGYQNEVFEKRVAFFVLVFLLQKDKRKKEKHKRKKAKKNSVLRWSSKNGKNAKKKGFLAKLA